MSYAAVHIPEFPVNAWKRTLGAHRQPLVLLDGVAPQEKVAARCEKARRFGVQHGMSKVQAQTACDALFRTRNLAEEQSAFTAACRVGERFTPRLQAIASPANCYGGAQHLSLLLLLDSSGMETLFGTVGNYACKLHEELTGEGFPAGIGTARNAEAALMLARSTYRIVTADEGNIRAKLGPLPVMLLPCDPRTLAILSRWGIRTLASWPHFPTPRL